ncbi:hypothetical protein EX326_10520 [Staphylococcus epidermidis]|nr:hypothetical protein [Staphylococcus epidermidis]NAN68528.1 hypothetical protein [Staphylococcus epidermidis]NAN81039.1 hypothetical protein [Staphylococcus epidermidis]NAN90964.1 hypothetical protein [Staphylococcus epidermidis]NAN97966.1 hypothetical protein [Staphylococcus epidermidis]
MFKSIRLLSCRNMFDYSTCKYYVGVVEVEIYYFNERNIEKLFLIKIDFKIYFRKNNLDSKI